MTFFQRKLIGDQSNPLMARYILFRFDSWGIFVHHFLRSDHDRALHDHPWPFIAIILKGGYYELHNQTIDLSETTEKRHPGNVLLRPAEWRHRVILPEGRTSWSLMIVGRRVRWWGFFAPTGWCHWRKYNPANGICEEHDLWEGNSD